MVFEASTPHRLLAGKKKYGLRRANEIKVFANKGLSLEKAA